MNASVLWDDTQYLQQEIAATIDAVMRKYHEDTSIDEKLDIGVADAMRLGAKEKATKLYAKMHVHFKLLQHFIPFL